MLYLSWKVDSSYAPWMVPFVVLGAVIYVLSPQINWWWYSRRPPELSPKLRLLLERFSGFYQGLDAAGQKRFRDRVVLYRMGTEWMPTGWPDGVMGPDVELAVVAQAAMLTFQREVFIFSKFEKVIVYPMPFPSPEYPFAHASELYAPDGCLLLSAEQVMAAFADPQRWYNVALHEYARVFMLSYPDMPYPELESEDIWMKLERVSNLSRQKVESVVGLAGVEALPVAIHHYFIFPKPFRDLLPEIAGQFDRIFIQN